ncbi:hypothetical protein E4T56_gene4849 [Termitomyces sp. T112]|nr:hypothetical protein E4T56_gene4849 [Termitomyces sp. T112]
MDTHDFLHKTSASHKKRNVERACDACRRRKTKCDGPQMPNHRCTNCVQSSKPCTYDEPSKPRGPPKAYITALEDKMEQLEALLKQLCPDKDYSKQLGPPVIRDSWKEDIQQPLWATPVAIENKVSLPHPAQQTPEETDHDSSEDPSAILDVLELPNNGEMSRKLELHGEEDAPHDPTEQVIARFHGKSSSVGLVGVAQMFKMMHLLENETKHDARLSSPDSVASTSSFGSSSSGSSIHRPEFWKMPERERQWEERNTDPVDSIARLLSAFPPPDLILELINIYFLHSNSPLPLLHRPTFDRQWKENLHHTNIWFAVVCLGIFSIASRWSSDARVIPDGATTASGLPDWSLAGWKYCKAGLVMFEVRYRLFCPTTLFELQSFSLFATYLRDSAHRPLAWTLVGNALRKAQDVGIHKKRVYGREPTVDSELWKRAFWCLIVLDRFESAASGRSALVGEEDFDVDLPVEVDDDYWEVNDSGPMFTQPEGLPANKIISFNQIIKLSRVLAFALKSLYAVDQQQLHSGLTPLDWRRAIMKHLAAGLEKWYRSLPEHLIWSNQKDDSPLAIDAAVLQTTYRLVEMLVYAMFITTSSISSSSSQPLEQGRLSPSDISPLDVCIDAAHDCANISQKQSLEALSTWPIYIYAAQVGSTMLLLKIWSIKIQEKTMHGLGIEDIKPPMLALEPLYNSLQTFVDILRLAEARWGFIAPYLQELRQALPDDAFGGMPISLQLGDGRQYQPQTSEAGYRAMETQGPEYYEGPDLPSLYPSLTQQIAQQPFSSTDCPYAATDALPQSQSPSQPPLSPLQHFSQRRLSYPPSDIQYSSRTITQPTQPPLPWNEPPNVLRSEERAQPFVPTVDYSADCCRQHTGDMPLLVKPSHGYNLPSNPGCRRLDQGDEMTYLYDRTKFYPSGGTVQDLPPSLPRTLHATRSLPYLGNPVPFSSLDTNSHRTRECQKLDNARESSYNEAAGFDYLAVRPAQDTDSDLSGVNYRVMPATGPYTKQDMRQT